MLERLARRALPVIALAALVPFAAACGDADEGGSSDPKAVDIEVANGKFTVPKSVESGLVEITFKNSDKADHEAGLIRIDGDHDGDDVIKALEQSEEKGIPGWIQEGGGVGTTKAGETRTSTEALSPGKWGVLDTEGRRPIVTEFEVTGEAEDAKDADLPEADGTVTARDYAFEASGLESGKNKVLFDNQGVELHHVIALPMRSGATLEDVKKVFESEGQPSGPPPFDEKNSEGTAVIDGGKKQVVDMELKPGKYVLACFITDRKGGPPHVAKGMVNETTVR